MNRKEMIKIQGKRRKRKYVRKGKHMSEQDIIIKTALFSSTFGNELQTFKNTHFYCGLETE